MGWVLDTMLTVSSEHEDKKYNIELLSNVCIHLKNNITNSAFVNIHFIKYLKRTDKTVLEFT